MWLWWQRRALTVVLGMAASCLLLAGPMVQVAYPLAAAISQAETVKFQDSSRVEWLKQEISSLESSLQTYERNSEKRLGWAERIDAANAALQQARARLLAQVSGPASIELSALKSAVIAGQAVALLLFQLVAVLGVLKLSRWSEPVAAVTASVAIENDAPSHEAVAGALLAYAQRHDLRGKALADALDEAGSTLHRVSKPGEFNVSGDVRRRVMTKLEGAR